MDTTIISIDELNEKIKNEIGTLIYFSTPTCNVCKVLRPKIMEEFKKNFPEIGRYYIDSTISQDIPVQFGVFTVPTILVLLDGKEFARESRNCSVGGLIHKISRPYKIMMS
jgi:thiol-disulfide isomerase/thioredoxin